MLCVTLRRMRGFTWCKSGVMLVVRRIFTRCVLLEDSSSTETSQIRALMLSRAISEGQSHLYDEEVREGHSFNSAADQT